MDWDRVVNGFFVGVIAVVQIFAYAFGAGLVVRVLLGR